MDYYEPLDLPVLGSRLTIDMNRPSDYIDSGDGITMRAQLRGRTRLTIEGESEFVQRIYRAASAEIEIIRQEIDGRS